MQAGLGLAGASQRNYLKDGRQKERAMHMQPTSRRALPFKLLVSCTTWHKQLSATPTHTLSHAGTNDNHRLLPLQVRQQLQVDPVLHATNGRMLAILLDNPQYDTLAVPEVRIT